MKTTVAFPEKLLRITQGQPKAYIYTGDSRKQVHVIGSHRMRAAIDFAIIQPKPWQY
jgi:hypothetical protein